ncbi:MAG: methyltransferase domain-containing protein [Bryobacteraceae bacterium]|nr:methyltransferase domain-containing protein [Bryobacteraceae bacterium]
MHSARVLVYILWASVAVTFAQNPQYDFYPEFRPWARELRRVDASIKRDQILERYATKVRTEGIAETEIQRRSALLGDSRNLLEDDFWNRFFTQGTSNYNRAPNEFLVEVVEGRKPGTALDYGMGAGRNALFLAKLGWQVSGFDPAAEAVSLAQKQAKELGLKLDTATVRDSEYEFGKARFDLVLFSWTMPEPVNAQQLAQKVAESLKPGGIVVMECGADWVGRNGMLKLFDGLQVVRYEILMAKSDFFDRGEMEVLRLVARKPAA